MRAEPLFQVVPRVDLVLDRTGTCLDRLQLRLQHGMNQTFFAFEVVIKLPFAGTRGLVNLVRTGRANALFMEKVCRDAYHPKLGVCVGLRNCLHSPIVPPSTSLSRRRFAKPCYFLFATIE